MARKGARRSSSTRNGRVEGNPPRAYEHTEEKLKPPKTYRYDPSLDPALSWDINADRERGEALIARIEQATDLAEAMLEYEGLGGQVQMIYMDPPYGVE